MQQNQKCCLHCPGKWTSSLKNHRDDHSCCLPKYVKGNLKISSLRKIIPGDAERSERLRGNSITKSPLDRPSSCYDRFAIAKKFHSENLQHQPLPDKVDDSVFKNVRLSNVQRNPSISLNKRSSSDQIRENRQSSRFCQRVKTGVEYGPTLGCKTPTTNMDLAICWEAPIDRSYEPPKALHIDGTDGGPAPAIFALVEHEIPQRFVTDHCKCFKNPVEIYEAKFTNVRNHCHCTEKKNKDLSGNIKVKTSPEVNDNRHCRQCPADPEIGNDEADLCNELNSIHISDGTKSTVSGNSIKSGVVQNRKVPLHLRNCSSCLCGGERSARKSSGPRLIQSACAGIRNNRKNGLSTKTTVPRPKTPYAKRSFCIDTLTPPFSIVNGCRDADYPEHWRLTSVYQQSYRNPRKQRGNILTYH